MDRYFEFERDPWIGIDKLWHTFLAVVVYWITGSVAWTVASEMTVEILQSVSMIEIKAGDPVWKVLLKRTLGYAKPSYKDIATAFYGVTIVWILRAFF